MASEEISFKLGLDAKPFQRGLTSLRTQVGDAAQGFKASLLAGFSVAGALAGLRAMGERCVELKRKAEDLGVSTSFMQGVERLAVKFGGTAESAQAALQKLSEKIGEARTEGGAAEEMFTRLGISLYDATGRARTNQEIFKAVADAYRNSSDAATKSALAFAVFGRAGRDVNNILEMGGSALDDYIAKQEAAGKILSAREVNAVANSWQDVNAALKMSGGWLENLAAKGTLAFLTITKLGSAIVATGGRGWSQVFREEMRKLQGEAPETGTRQQDEAKRAVAQAAELGRLSEQREKVLRAQLDDEGKLRALAEDQRRIAAQMANLEPASLKFKSAELKLLESQAESRRLSEGIEKRMLALAEKRGELEKERAGIIADVNAKRIERLLYTRDELKSLKPDDIIPQHRKLFTAQQKQLGNIETLEGFGRDARSKGNLEYARRIDLLVERLLRNVTLLKPDDRLPWREQEKRLAELNAQLGPPQPGVAVGAPLPGVQQFAAGIRALQPGPINPLQTALDNLAADVKRLRDLSEGRGLNVQPRMGR